MDGLNVLREVFASPQVTQHFQNAPESWLWSLINAIVSAVPLSEFKLLPSTFVTVFTALFAILNPGYIEQHVKTAEFYATPRTELRTQYDYIIVGGGTAGCLLANRLSADHSVLLIEAGTVTNILNHVPMLNTINFNEPTLGVDWLYYSVEQKHAFRRIRDRKTHMGGGKGIGGSSHINFQVYSRSFDESYDRWETIFGAKGWNAKEMVHFMKLHENVHNNPAMQNDRRGNDGELSVMINPLEGARKTIIDAWYEAGAKATSTAVIEDHNIDQFGFARMQQTTSPITGASSHSGKAFIDPIREERKDNLHIILDSMVDKVIIDENKVATGVEVLTCTSGSCLSTEKKDRLRIKSLKEVILSSGTARSPQILMLSGIGPKDELEKLGIPVKVDLPAVGANLHDHLLSYGTSVSFKSKESGEPGKGWFDWELKELHKFFANRTGMFMSASSLLGVSFVNTPISEDLKRPDLEMVAIDFSLGAPLTLGSLMKFGMRLEDIPAFAKGTKPHENRNGLILASVLLRPKTRGKLYLKSKDVNDHPIFDIQYLDNDHDVNVLLEGLKYLKKSIAPLSAFGAEFILSRLPGCDQEDMESDEYLRCHLKSLAMSIWHMGGTCRLGSADDPTAVVDPDLRVRGVRNLRVADASILPEPTSGHMVATVYGIAEKAAHIILGKQSQRDEL